MSTQLLHLNMLLKITHKKSILLKKRCNFQRKRMQKPSESNELIREECFMLEKVNGGKDVPGFLSSLCWHKETPPGWGDCYHQEALGWDPASSSILISSSLTKMSGILRRTKLPKKSPIPAQPRGRCLTGHTLHWTLLLGSPWAHKQYSNPGVPQTKSLFLLHVLYTILEMNIHHLLKNKQEKSLPTDVVLWKLKYLCKHRQG